MMDTDPPPLHCHFDESIAAKSHASNGRNTDPPLVISTEAKQRNLSPMVCSIATGDLSAQRFNNPEVFIPTPPCPSARDDGGGRQHTVISKGQMTETPPCPVVISTEAKRSGEISRLKWQKRCFPLVISTKAEQQNRTSPWYTRMAADSTSSQGHNKRAVGNDFHFPQPLLTVRGYSYFST